MCEPFTLPVDDVRPSQLYLSGRKLVRVASWFDFDEPNYDPLPVRRIGGEWTLTDGHTRAFVAHLSGAEEFRVVEDTDDPPMGVYERCVSWCRGEGVTAVSDLAGRVVTARTFEERWVARCRSLDG